MATTDPNQKFAFLLTGSTSNVYLEDMKLVYTMLTEYYNYPKTNIYVVFGDSIADTSFFDVDASKKLVLEAGKTITHLETLFTAFKLQADTSSDNTMLLYFTGDDSDSPALSLNGIASSIDTTWYNDNVNNFLSGITNAELNVVMQQSNSGDFETTVSNAVTSAFSFTSACSTVQTAVAGVAGNKFTEAWTAGLRLEASTGGTNTGTFADQASPVSSPNYLVSLEQAKTFAADWMDDDTNQSPQYNDSGDLFLGRHDYLYIRDGDQDGGTEPFWESPDIFINNTVFPWPTFTNNDEYLVDENEVRVRVKNIGTHPLRKFWLGTKNFGSGLGTTDYLFVNELATNNPVGDTKLTEVVKAGTEHIHMFKHDYSTIAATHRCIMARAQITTIDPLTIDEWSEWSIQPEDTQAQRNIDAYVAPPVPPPPDPDPDPDPGDEAEAEAPDPNEGAIPETDTEADPAPEMEDATDTGTEQTEVPPNETPTESEERGERNIRRYREHIYEIKNTYKRKHKFMLVFPKEYEKYSKLFRMEWFEMSEGFGTELKKLKIERKPYLHIPFVIEPGENRRILSYLALRKDVKLGDKEIKMPFEILVDKKDFIIKDRPLRVAIMSHFRKKFTPVSGLTLKVTQGSADYTGIVYDGKGEPVPGAWVFIKSKNNRQGAVLRTRKNGVFKTKMINPDEYGIAVVTKDWFIKEKNYYLKDGKNDMKFSAKEAIPGKPIKVILDKIRILDDKDPFILGKGEFNFTSIVIPDGNEKERQIQRFPKKGDIKISDRPGKNELELGLTIFEGAAQESLSINIFGVEHDVLPRDDKLKKYLRSFSGNPVKWYGKYGPNEEYSEKERIGDWELWYRIVRF